MTGHIHILIELIPRYKSLQALQRPYLYGGPIVSILLTGSFVGRTKINGIKGGIINRLLI
jgi:hypothetical protein